TPLERRGSVEADRGQGSFDQGSPCVSGSASGLTGEPSGFAGRVGPTDVVLQRVGDRKALAFGDAADLGSDLVGILGMTGELDGRLDVLLRLDRERAVRTGEALLRQLVPPLLGPAIVVGHPDSHRVLDR